MADDLWDSLQQCWFWTNDWNRPNDTPGLSLISLLRDMEAATEALLLQGPVLPIRINVNPNMDKKSHTQ